MNCDICGLKEAVIHIKQITNDRETILHLCESCAAFKGIETDKNRVEFSISNLLTGLVDIQAMPQKPQAHKECSSCGMTLEEFKKETRPGCAECFIVFSGEIESLLHKMYGGQIEHRGKYPAKYREYKNSLEEIGKLNKKLDSALKKEDYEKAAEIRDKIKILEERTSIKTGKKNGG